MIDKAIFALPGVKQALALLTILSALRALTIMGQAWSLASAITNLWYGAPLAEQTIWMGLFLLCFIGRQVIVYAQDSYLDTYAYTQADSLREDLLHEVFSSGAEVVQAKGSGSITTTVLEGVDQVETYFRIMLPKITGIVVIPLFLLVLVFTLDWISGVILFIIFPFVVLYMVLLGYSAKDRAAKQHSSFQILSNHFIDSLRGIDTLKLFGIGKSHGETIYEVSERFRKATMRTLAVAILSSLALDMFSTLSLAAVSIMLGLRLLEGSLLLFPALTILILAPEYFKPIRDFAGDYHASLDGKNALSSILELIARPKEVHEERELPFWNDTAQLTIAEMNFSYPDLHVLRDVAFKAKGFMNVGIVGMSGAGKSTLVNLLGGFYTPDKATISIEGTAISDFKQKDWQKQIIYIPQDPYIFHASLKDNIVFYQPSASIEDIDQAIATVGLEQMVDELPQGIDTIIGEGARALSGGQAQRIALARAFLDKERKILLFDEPTAHLDIETEMELKERMLPLMEDRLVFFATHRLHWMHEMDTILVMDKGEITEQGSLRELISHDGSYTRLSTRVSEEQL